MNNDLSSLDASSLQQLYDKEVADLHEKLLTGTPWNELSNYRKRVTELSIALNKKVSSRQRNPAELPGSPDRGRENQDMGAPQQ